MAATVARWTKFLVAVVLGNGLYFALSPHLPPAARHQRFQLDLGTLVDLWFCMLVYGILETAAYLRRRKR